jgi:sialidase-1
LVWNNTNEAGAGHGGRRTPLTAAVSADAGKTWKHVRDLEDRTDRTYAYTSLIFHQDRAVPTYYVADEKTGRISCRLRSLPINRLYEQGAEGRP